MTLQLVKIEEGLCSGGIIFSEYGKFVQLFLPFSVGFLIIHFYKILNFQACITFMFHIYSFKATSKVLNIHQY